MSDGISNAGFSTHRNINNNAVTAQIQNQIGYVVADLSHSLYSNSDPSQNISAFTQSNGLPIFGYNQNFSSIGTYSTTSGPLSTVGIDCSRFVFVNLNLAGYAVDYHATDAFVAAINGDPSQLGGQYGQVDSSDVRQGDIAVFNGHIGSVMTYNPDTGDGTMIGSQSSTAPALTVFGPDTNMGFKKVLAFFRVNPSTFGASPSAKTAQEMAQFQKVVNQFSTPTQQCFHDKTLIKIANGETKTISNITKDIYVLSFNAIDTSRFSKLLPARVTRLFRNITTEWIELHVPGQDPVFVTSGHRYLRPEGGFAEIGAMIAAAETSADPLILVSETGALVTATWQRHVYSAETADQFEQGEIIVYNSIGGLALQPEVKRGWLTYNFEVEGLHTYIAGGIRVHNDSANEVAGAIANMATDNNLTTVSYNSLTTDFGPATAEAAAFSADAQQGFSFSLDGLAKYKSAIEAANQEHPDPALLQVYQQNFYKAVQDYSLNVAGTFQQNTTVDAEISAGKFSNFHSDDYGQRISTITSINGVTVSFVQDLTRNTVYSIDPNTGLEINGGFLGLLFGGISANTSTPDDGFGSGGSGGGLPTMGGGSGPGFGPAIGGDPSPGGSSVPGGSSGSGDGSGTGGGGVPGGSSAPGGSSGSGGSSPIILDLTGNGIKITQQQQSSVFMDVDGSGYKQQTAWAGVGNGVLFYDASGKGQLTEANQFIFTDWDPSATTDLQALENVFDSNHDGQLDASDADYGDFFVMVTNADGSRTAHSLSSLDISAIGLTSNAYASGLPDGSGISGETSYTITTTTTTQGRSAGGTETTTTIMENAVASVTLASGGADYAVTTTTTTNADGSTTIDNVANNPDGSLAYSRLQNTTISGGTTTKTLSDISAGGVVTSLETVTTTTPAYQTTTETVVDYRGGTVNAAGEIVSSGERLDATTTTTTQNPNIANTTTISRDQTGGDWTSQTEVDRIDQGVQAGDSQIVITDLNPDGSTRQLTTTTIGSYGTTRTSTVLVDGNAAWSSTSVQTTTPAVVFYTPTTNDVVNSVGTTVVSHSLTQTTTSQNGTVTSVITADETDGTTLDLTTTETSTSNASGATQTTVETNGDGSLRQVTVTTIDPTGLLKTTKVDSTGLGSAAAPIFDAVSSDNTVINSDGSRTETVIDTAQNGQLRDQSVTWRGTDGVSRTISTDSTGDGLNDQVETITVTANVITDTTRYFNPNGTLAGETVVVSGSGGLSKTTSTDTTGAVTGSGAAVFDLVTTDVTTHNSDGSSTQAIADTNQDGSLRDRTQIWTSGNGLDTTTSTDDTGPSGVADGVWDRVTTDNTVINSDGSLTETITTTSANGAMEATQVITTSANRLVKTATTTLGTSNLIRTVETVTTQSNGTVIDATVHYDANGDVTGATSTSTLADGLVKISQIDSSGQAAGSAISYDRITTDQTAINADGSRTETVTTTSSDGTLLARSIATRSANGMSVTTVSDPYGLGWNYTQSTDVKTINANGSTTEMLTDANSNGSKRDQTITTVSATGLSTTTTKDFNGDGTVDLTTTDVTTINADGSKTEIVTATNAHGVRDQITTTTGVISAYGTTSTIASQWNADQTGSMAVYSLETISTGADGTVSDVTQVYASVGGVEVYATKTTESANGLVKSSSVDVDGSGNYALVTLDTTTLNADGSTTETIARSNGNGLISETVTTKSANGLWISTSVDANGAMSSGLAVFNAVTTDDTVLNNDGSETETVTTINAAGSVYEETVTTTSADQQGITIDRFFDETGSILIVDQHETKQTQVNGSVVDVTMSYDSAHALLGTITKMTSGNGLLVTMTYANASGGIVDTQSSTTTLNSDGSKTEVFSDQGESATTITTHVSGNGLTKTESAVFSGPVGSASIFTSDTTTPYQTGGTTETVADTVGAFSDTSTITTSADGRIRTATTYLNGDGNADIVTQTILNLDGSKIETTNDYVPFSGALAWSSTVDTSVDGRTINTTIQSDYDGANLNVETDVYVENANHTTTETLTATGSFGAMGDRQTIATANNRDGSRSTTTLTSTLSGSVYVQTVVTTSANGLASSFAYDTTGSDTLANLQAASADLINGAVLPTLLSSDIIGSDVTTLNADGSTSEVSKIFYGNGSLRSNIVTTTSANGLVKTTAVDDDGNGISEQVRTTTAAPDGSSRSVIQYFADRGAQAGQQIGADTITTNADGLVSTLTTSNGITDTTTRFADGSGSYQWTRAVSGGSSGAQNGASTHIVDANGIDTWSWSNGPVGATSGTISIDLATEQRDIATANTLYTTILGRDMTDAETQYLAQYIQNGVLNRTALAMTLVGSLEYAGDYAGVPLTYAGLTYQVFQDVLNVLGRVPTSAELAQFAPSSLQNGVITAQTLAATAIAIAQYAQDLAAGGVPNLASTGQGLAVNFEAPVGAEQNYVVELGGGATVNLSTIPDHFAALIGTANVWDNVTGSNGCVYLVNAQASVSGGGDTIYFSGGTGNAASLSNTGGALDLLNGSNGWVYLTSAQASIVGGGDTIFFSGGTGNVASLFQTSGNWDIVSGSNGEIDLNNVSASIFGGGDTLVFANGTTNNVNISNTNGNWDLITGSNSWIYQNNAQASVTGGDNTIFMTNSATSLYGTNNNWDVIVSNNNWIYENSSQASIIGGGNTVLLFGTGDIAGISGTSGNWDVLSGSNSQIQTASAQAGITGNSDTIEMSGTSVVAVSGNSDIFAFGASIGQEMVSGFNSTDIASFSVSDFTNWNSLQSHLSQSGQDTLITYDANDTVRLVGVTASNLTQSNFKFA